MARLASIAVAGFFPTPPRVTARIARFLEPTPPQGRRAIRLLDPCAGEGTAAAMLGQALGAETYGIEVQEDRARIAAGALGRVLHTDNRWVRVTHGGWSVLFLNPPYDYDDAKKRLEHYTLTDMTRALCGGGVLVFLLPLGRLGVSARYLAAHYENLSLFRFPDPEFEAFKQVVVFATKKYVVKADNRAQLRLEQVSHGQGNMLPELPDAPDEVFRVPRLAPSDNLLFAPQAFDPTVARAEADKRGVFTDPIFRDLVWPPEFVGVRPLLGLRRGHRAMLLAGGMVNNERLDGDDGRPILVKGRISKVLVPVHHKTTDEDGNDIAVDDDKVKVEREVLRTSMWMLYLDTGDFEQIESGL